MKQGTRNYQIRIKPLTSAIALRFNPDFNILPILEETIKEGFFLVPSKVEIILEFTNKLEIKIFKKPKHWGDEHILIFSMCYVGKYPKDFFFCIAIRTDIGIPDPNNITLLRHFIKKLQDKKIKYEIW